MIFVNDGSRDRSPRCCASSSQRRPDVTRVMLFNGNFGQHMAIMAGFERARGERVVTLDADLQNPPEEIASCSRRWTRATTTSAPSAARARTTRSGASPRAR